MVFRNFAHMWDLQTFIRVLHTNKLQAIEMDTFVKSSVVNPY